MYEFFLSKSNFTRIDDMPVFELDELNLSFDPNCIEEIF
jgi:hypothetical protein